ncbi:MAG: hypothetical protein QXQ18_01180 [Candidatus Aenigmatarchaeota archaeon]
MSVERLLAELKKHVKNYELITTEPFIIIINDDEYPVDHFAIYEERKRACYYFKHSVLRKSEKIVREEREKIDSFLKKLGFEPYSKDIQAFL